MATEHHPQEHLHHGPPPPPPLTFGGHFAAHGPHHHIHGHPHHHHGGSHSPEPHMVDQKPPPALAAAAATYFPPTSMYVPPPTSSGSGYPLHHFDHRPPHPDDTPPYPAAQFDYHHYHNSAMAGSPGYDSPYGGSNSELEDRLNGGNHSLVGTNGSDSLLALASGGIEKKKGVAIVGVGSNKKERRRTQSINTAYANLRDCIPNVPVDTKLSKIKTLRLATSYIDYLMTMLHSDSPETFLEGFKADIHKKWNEKSEDQKRRELEEELNNNGSSHHRVRTKKGGARTGWPQHVWALELK